MRTLGYVLSERMHEGACDLQSGNGLLVLTYLACVLTVGRACWLRAVSPDIGNFDIMIS